jgi:hypothetical protein
MHTATQPARSLITLELTQDQVLHLTAAIATSMVGESHFPAMFRIEHDVLYDILMGKLTEEQQVRIENARRAQEEDL